MKYYPNIYKQSHKETNHPAVATDLEELHECLPRARRDWHWALLVVRLQGHESVGLHRGVPDDKPVLVDTRAWGIW